MADNFRDLELERFIARYVHSVEQLEILCLLSRNPELAWSAKDVFRVVQSSHQSIASRLEEFQQKGFLLRDGADRYRYSPKGPVLARAVAALAKAYQERRVAVVEWIYRQPLQIHQNPGKACRSKRMDE